MGVRWVKGREGRRRDTWEGTILGNWQAWDSTRVWGSSRLPQARGGWRGEPVAGIPDQQSRCTRPWWSDREWEHASDGPCGLRVAPETHPQTAKNAGELTGEDPA